MTTEEFVKVALAAVGINEKDDADWSAAERLKDQNKSSNFLSQAIHKMRASLAVGLNCPVSIELIVFRDTPTISASWVCDIFSSARASLRRFLI